MEIIKKYNGYASYAIAIFAIVLGFLLYATTADGVATSTDIFLYASYLFIVLVIVAMVGGLVVALATDFKSMVGSLISMGVMLVLFIIFYVIADGTVTPEYAKIKGTFDVSSFALKMTESTFYLTYFLMLGILGALGWGAVKSFTD